VRQVAGSNKQHSLCWSCQGQAEQLAAQGVVLPQPGLLEAGQAQQSVSDAAAPQVILDWKGDPMTINPNDNMPFF